MNESIWLKIAIGYVAVIGIIITISSVIVVCSWFQISVPTPPTDLDKKDAVEAYAALVTARNDRATGLYHAVIIEGFVPMFNALIAGIVAYVVIPKAITMLRSSNQVAGGTSDETNPRH
jgi:hypothetical protein